MTETNETHPEVSRLPTCPESHRDSIDAFLQNVVEKVERALNDHRALAMMDKSERLRGQINHFRKYVQCLRWLISMNESRRRVHRAVNK